MNPAKRQLMFAAGGRLAVQRMTYTEGVITLVGDDGTVAHATVSMVEAAAAGTVIQCTPADLPAFGGYGALPMARAG